MSVSTFMQFGTESDIDTKDVGQPKFQLRETTAQGEPLYVLLGSLHMPHEDCDAVDAVEAYVNTWAMRTMLIDALSHYFARPIDASSTFMYVPRYRGAYVSTTSYQRTAS